MKKEAVIKINVEMPHNEQMALIEVLAHIREWHAHEFTQEARDALMKVSQAAIRAVEVKIINQGEGRKC